MCLIIAERRRRRLGVRWRGGGVTQVSPPTPPNSAPLRRLLCLVNGDEVSLATLTKHNGVAQIHTLSILWEWTE